MQHLLHILTYAGLFWVAAIILFGLGLIVLEVLRIQVGSLYYRLFLSFVLGLSLLSIISALYFTKFNSVLTVWLVSLLAFYLWYRIRVVESPSAPFRASKWPALSQQISPTIKVFNVGTILFLVWLYPMLDFGTFILKLPHSDYNFYAYISQSLSEFGKENLDHIGNELRQNPVNTVPYHYYELWINTALARLFAQPHLLILMHMTFPLLLLGCALGLIALVEWVNKRVSWKNVILSALLVGMGGFVLNFFINSPLTPTLYFNNVYYTPKLAPIYMFMLLSFNFLIRGKVYLAGVSCLSIAYLSFATLPAVVGGLGLLSVVGFLFKIEIPKEGKGSSIHWRNLGLMSAIVGVSILGYYKLTGGGTTVGQSVDIISELQQPVKFIKYLVGLVALTALAYLPISLLLGWSTIKRSIESSLIIYLLLLGSIFFVGVVAHFIYRSNYNGDQLFWIIFAPAFSVLLSYWFILMASSFVLRFYWIRIVMLVLIITIHTAVALRYKHYNSLPYTQSFVNEILSSIQETHLSKTDYIAFLTAKSDNTHPHAGVHRNFRLMGYYLHLFEDNIYLIDISDFYYPNTDDINLINNSKAVIESSIFFNYVADREAKSIEETIGASQLAFVNEKNIKYVLASPDADISSLEGMIKEIITDKNTGQRFIKL